jgi:hypothetical protein
MEDAQQVNFHREVSCGDCPLSRVRNHSSFRWVLFLYAAIHENALDMRQERLLQNPENSFEKPGIHPELGIAPLMAATVHPVEISLCLLAQCEDSISERANKRDLLVICSSFPTSDRAEL